MAQEYGRVTGRTEHVSPVSLTPGERSTGMTTGESAQHMEMDSHEVAPTTKHVSLLGKVKAKAKKLRSKLKHGHEHHHEHGEPLHEQQQEHHAREHADYSSNGTDEEENPELGYTPVSKPFHTEDTTSDSRGLLGTTMEEPMSKVLEDERGGASREDRAGPMAAGGAPPNEAAMAPVNVRLQGHEAAQKTTPLRVTPPPSENIPISAFKSPGPEGVEQAVPTSYHYYGGDSPRRQEETPAVAGAESAGVAPVFQDWTSFGSGADRSFSSGQFSLHGYSNRSEDSVNIPVAMPLHPSSSPKAGEQPRFGGPVAVDDGSNRSHELPEVTRSEEEDRNAKIPLGILSPLSPRTSEASEHIRRPVGGSEAAGESFQSVGEFSSRQDRSSRSEEYPSVSRPEGEEKDAKIPLGILSPLSPKTSDARERMKQRQQQPAAAAEKAVGQDVSTKQEQPQAGAEKGVEEQPLAGAEKGTEKGVDQDVGISPTKKVSDTLTQTKDAALEKMGYASPSPDESRTPRSPPSSPQEANSTAVESPTTIVAPKVDAAVAYLGQKIGLYRGYEEEEEQGFGASPTSTISRSPCTTHQAQPSIAQKAYETLVHTKEAAAEKLFGHHGERSPTDQHAPSVAQKVYDTIVGTPAAGKVSGHEEEQTRTAEPTLAQKAYDTVVGAKEAAVAKLYGEDQSPQEPTIAQKTYDTVGGAKDDTVSKLSGEEQTPKEPTMAQKAYDTIMGAKDTAMSKIYGEDQSPKEPTVADKAYGTVLGEKERSYAQGEEPSMIQKAKDAVVGETQTSPHSATFYDSKTAPLSEFKQEAESKPMTQKAGEIATGLKESIASTLGVASPSPTDRSPTSAAGSDQKPLIEKLTETGVGLKETVASKLGYGGSPVETTSDRSSSTPSEASPVLHKASEVLHQARDVTVSSMTPSEEDRALSESVTESISNLPHLLSEKLGMSPHGSPAATSPSSKESEMEVPVSPAGHHGDEAASPSIVSRMTDAMSTLFGGAKRPVNNGEEFSPRSSPTGAGERNVMDSAAAAPVTDTSVHRSSPAA